ERPQSDLKWVRDPDVREGIRPVLADLGHTAQFLANKGVVLTNDAQSRFLDCVLENYIEFLFLLERRAKGDYSPDELPSTFPAFCSTKPKSTGPTPREMFDAWVKGKGPAHSTVESWRTVFNALTARFPDKNADGVTPDEAQAWLDSLITKERSAHTVRNW